jgi:hypothetical protein
MLKKQKGEILCTKKKISVPNWKSSKDNIEIMKMDTQQVQ